MRHALLALALSTCHLPQLDHGLLSDGAYELRPAVLPWHVVAEPGIELDGAMAFWASHCPAPPFAAVPGAVPGTLGVVDVATGPVELGQAELQTDSAGRIVSASILLAPMATDWQTVVLTHELGHCLGLADDERSIDLRSIMAGSGLSPGLDHRLTEQDAALIGCAANR